MAAFGQIVTLALALLLANCGVTFLDSRSKDEGKSGTSTGDDEKEPEPVPVTGSQLVDYDHTLPRCRFSKEAEENTYQVRCQLVITDDQGGESLALGFKPGVETTWAAPEKTSGAELSHVRCSATQNALAYDCTLTLAKAEVTKVAFALTLKQDAKLKIASDVVVLPYLVASYGLVRQVPRLYLEQAQKSPADADKQNLAFQSLTIDPKLRAFARISSMCRRGERLFFASTQFVYVFAEGKIHLYAGNPNTANKDELSSRLRVHLTNTSGDATPDLSLACGEDAVYVADGFRRLLKIADQGPVKLLVDGALPGQKYGSNGLPIGELNLGGGVYLHVGKNGDLIFSSYSQIWRLQADGKIYLVGGKSALSFPNSSGDGGRAVDAEIPLSLDLTEGPDGAIYFSQGTQIRKINPQGMISAFAGTGVGGYGGDGGPAVAAQISSARGLQVSSAGHVYFADVNNDRIRAVDAQGVIRTVVGTGQHQPAGDGGPALAEVLPTPFAMVLGNTGALLIGDDQGRILQAVIGGDVKMLIGNVRPVTDPRWTAATVDELYLFNPTDLDLDQQGNIFFAHRGLQIIQKIDNAGGVTVVGGKLNLNAAPGAGDGGLATAALFTQPSALANGPDGSKYIIVDAAQMPRIRKIDPSGMVTTIAGTGDAGFAGDGGPASLARFANPQKLTVASDGTIYVADTGNHRIRRIRGGTITTIAGNGQADFSGDGRAATAAALKSPTGVAVDAAGVVLIADTGNGRIRRVDAAGIIHTIAGQGPSASELPLKFADGALASQMQLKRPVDVVTTVSGKIYFIDEGISGVALLNPQGNDYQVKVVLGGDAVQDCGVGITNRGTAGADNLEERLKASAAVICLGRPRAISVVENCQRDSAGVLSGTTVLGLLHQIDSTEASANIIKLERPCF